MEDPNINIKKWDEWNKEDGGPKYPHEKVIQFCFRNYPREKRKFIRALDLGCGSGVHSVFLASEGFDVTGIDISREGIANTKRKIDALNLRANLQVGSADILDFPSNSFDLVVSVSMFDAAGFDVAKKSVERLRKVLAAGALGIFIFASDKDYRVNGLDPHCIKRGISLHGFTFSEVEEIYHEGFSRIWIDRYITTYEGGRIEQNDWLITIKK